MLSDPEAIDNNKFVTYDLLKKANISSSSILPMCQDTGTAIIMSKKSYTD
nr:fumarate hydratase [Bartonella clarridgeiae]